MTDTPNNTVALVTDEMLMAYVDGVLDARSRLLVEHYLAAHPEAAERVAAYEEQDRELHALFDTSLAESLPPEIEALTQRLREAGRLREGALERSQRPARRLGFLAASVAALALLAGGSYVGLQYGFPDGQTFVASTIQETGTSLSPQAGILPAGGAVGAASALAPDLTGYGFSLTGDKALGASQLAGSAVPGETRQLTYQNAGGQWMTLYVGPSGPASVAGKAEAPVVSVQGQGTTILLWQSAGQSYSLIG
ncbi:MAG: hypothetical protein KKB63_15430, partial [Alphaproteobacteria bacterium]|nr:hypothetical protein [Alphaproteobacteria bacterium]